MADEISHELTTMPGGFHGQVEIWTSAPWVGMRHGSLIPGRTLVLRNEWVAACWIGINQHLQGTKPNRWIGLDDAVWIITQKLSVPPGVARDLLLKEATPPAVPWVGLYCRLTKDGTHLLEPVDIDLSTFTRAEVYFGDRSMWLQGRDEPIRDPYIELNHLEAWMERYEGRTALPVPPAPANGDPAPKNKGGAPRKFDKEAFIQRAARELVRLEGNERKKRQTLTAIMAEWCLATWGEEPDPTTLRRWMAEIFTPPED
jgi:hypothetical protein